MYSKVILAVFLFFFILISFQPITGATSDSLKEVDDITNLLNEQQLTIKSWEVTLKEKINPNDVSEIKEKITSTFPQSTFVKQETSEIIKHIISKDDANGVTEHFILLEPKKNNHQSEMIYQLSGEIWDDQIRSDNSIKLENLLHTIFSDEVQKLSCIVTQPSDMINSVYIFENIGNKLDVQYLNNKVNEPDFTVFSGYTPHWSSAIPVADKSINLQMAAREGLGGKTTITIGTPIIVTEY